MQAVHAIAALAILAATSPQSDSSIVRMFAAARAHDVAGVVSGAPKASTTETNLARALALALADPATYTEAYIEQFAKHGGFSAYHYLDDISAAGLIPANAAFDIVSKRAAAGDAMAYAAILGAVAPLTEFHAPFDQYSVAQHPEKIFAAMKVAGPEVVAAYVCTQEDEGRDPGYPAREVAVLQKRAGTPAGRTLVAKLKALVSKCSEYDANF